MFARSKQCLWLVVLLLTPEVLRAQGSSDPQVTFKTRSELVTVPVVVTDKFGVHIRSLKKGDFVLLEDGKEQKIATFDEIVKLGAPSTPSTPPDQFSNVLGLDPKPINLTILVLDLVNTPFEDQAYAKGELIKYLSQSVGTQPTSIFALTRNGLKVIHDFATSPRSLSTALQKAPGEHELVEPAGQEAIPAGTSPMVAQAMERMHESEQRMESLERVVAIKLTLQAMQQIAQSCSGLPGRKAMLWASAGFPFSVNELSMVMNIAGSKLDSFDDISDLYEKTWRALNQAQVAVYPVDVRGLTSPSVADVSISNPRREAAAHAAWMNTETIGTFQTFAQATGGRAFFNTNDLKGAFEQAADDNSEYYLLTYYLDSANKAPGWHKLSVHVRREGSEVRSRSGFFLTPAKPGIDDKTEMQIALGSPLNYTSIPITGRWQQVLPSKEPGKKTAIFLLSMPASLAGPHGNNDNHLKLKIAAVALTATGTSAGESLQTIDGYPQGDDLKQIRTHGLDYRGGLVVPPGEYTVRFAVEDLLNGRIGSVSAHLTVTP